MRLDGRVGDRKRGTLRELAEGKKMDVKSK
jgi:hypothetical protein